MRYWLGRKRIDPSAGSEGGRWSGIGLGTGKRKGVEGDAELTQGDLPDWARRWLPKGFVPFLCGSLAGVTSWALIYPVDVRFFLLEIAMHVSLN